MEGGEVAVAEEAVAEGGYVNGSDMLLYINGKAVGHCSSHTTRFNAETKERAVKPVASLPKQQGKWKNKTVSGMSLSVSAEGLCFYKETENGYKESLALAAKGDSVDVKCMERGSEAPYLEGKFIITSLERTDPAQDDSTYSISLENDGMPTTFDSEVLS